MEQQSLERMGEREAGYIPNSGGSFTEDNEDVSPAMISRLTRAPTGGGRRIGASADMEMDADFLPQRAQN
jgi:hypothetical protein